MAPLPALSPLADLPAAVWFCYGGLLLALLVVAWRWRMQRALLHSARAETARLRAELHGLRGHDAPQGGAPDQAPPDREPLYSALISHIPGAAYRCTPEPTPQVVYISDVIERLTGWTADDCLASPARWRAFVHPDDRARVEQQIRDAIVQGQGFVSEYRAMHRDGRALWAWEQGHAVHDAHGTLLCLDGVIVDISARKAMESALRDAKERAEVAAASKTMFLANMGHEVRTPLNAIIGFSEIVLKTPLDGMQREHVYKVRQAAHALLRLVNDVLDMARLEHGTLALACTDFSLHDLLHEALQAHRAAADRKGLALQFDADPALGDCFHGDAPRLRQVIDRLLDNAIKFTERGSVRLQLGRQHGQVLLAVHDTGIGIASDRQDQIFEAFAQADPTMRRRHGGIGLGVTIAQQLLQHMGGSLTVHSTPGRGSSFRVLVPLATGTVPALAAARPSEPEQPLPHAAPATAAAAFGRNRDGTTCAASPARQVALPQEVLRNAIDALRNGDHTDTSVPTLLHGLRDQGLASQAAQVERALAVFDLDLAAELLETLPARL